MRGHRKNKVRGHGRELIAQNYLLSYEKEKMEQIKNLMTINNNKHII
jgi:hypothetical protein